MTSNTIGSLEDDGFVHLREVLSADELDAICGRICELTAHEGASAGSETYTEAGSVCLADLINKGREFHIVLTQPRVLECVAHVLGGDFKLSSLNSRAALPRHGQQHLHADWDEPYTAGEFQVCNTIWLLDDFTRDNGATRIVPGSHRKTNRPQDEMSDLAAPHPHEILLLGRAGDVFVFNAHAWHGGTQNRTEKPRRAMHAYFCRRNVAAQLDQQKFLRAETREALSPEALRILGVT